MSIIVRRSGCPIVLRNRTPSVKKRGPRPFEAASSNTKSPLPLAPPVQSSMHPQAKQVGAKIQDRPYHLRGLLLPSSSSCTVTLTNCFLNTSEILLVRLQSRCRAFYRPRGKTSVCPFAILVEPMLKCFLLRQRWEAGIAQAGSAARSDSCSSTPLTRRSSSRRGLVSSVGVASGLVSLCVGNRSRSSRLVEKVLTTGV
jgi:hypothetical protein